MKSRGEQVGDEQESVPTAAAGPPRTRNSNPIANKRPPQLLLLILLATHLENAVQLATSTITVQPSNGIATLVPNQPLHFECKQLGNERAQFLWYKRNLGDAADVQPQLLEPTVDDTVEIHNERLALLRPNYNSLGDYICRALKGDKSSAEADSGESATIKLRASPRIEDFGVETSHTGKSAEIVDGKRLELNCRVLDESTPVNITWLRSDIPDDDRHMVPLLGSATAAAPNGNQLQAEGGGQLASSPIGFDAAFSLPAAPTSAASAASFAALAQHNIVIEKVGNFSKRLIIEAVGPEHRSYYTCIVDNGVTERTRRTIFVRIKDRFVALWPFLGILAEIFILFTIIHVWETRRAFKAVQEAPAATPTKAGGGATNSASKRHAASSPANAFESVPLNR